MAKAEDIAESTLLPITDRALLDEELEDLEASEESPTSVTYSTQDYPVDGLVKRLNSAAMLIPQFRGTDSRVKWTNLSNHYCLATRFLEFSWLNRRGTNVSLS